MQHFKNIGAGLLILAVFFALIVVMKPAARAKRPNNSSGEPELLVLDTKETPEVSYLPTGTIEVRFDKPLTISSDFLVGIGQTKSVRDMELNKSTVTVHAEGSSVKLKQKGAYFVMIFTRNLEGKPDTGTAVRVMIIIGPWPHPVNRKLLRPVPDWIRLSKAPHRGFSFGGGLF